MTPYPFPRTLHLALLFSLACILLATNAPAQQTGVAATRITTTLSLDAQDYPLTVAYVYEEGRTHAEYSANGSYTQRTAQDLGNLLSVVIFNTTTLYAIIDNETTPGTGRTALVSFTSAQETDGSTTAIISAEIVPE